MEGSASTTMEQIKPTKPSNKRKRDSTEWNGQGRTKGTPSSTNGAGSNDVLDDLLLGESHEFSNLGQQLARHNSTTNNAGSSTAIAAGIPHMTAPPAADLSFQSANTVNDEDRVDSSFDMGAGGAGDTTQHSHSEGGVPYSIDSYPGNGSSRNQSQLGGGSNKPAVGTEEWHKVRKDNHKEVERRRRETINEGINELAKIVPGDDKNKGAILQRGVNYIAELNAQIQSKDEKHTLEKLLTDQAIQELSTANDKLKKELERAWNEATKWKTLCLDAGIVPKDGDDGTTGQGNNT